MKKNRILCLALSLVMLLGIVFPVNVFAEDIILEDEEYEEYYENGNDFVEEILVEEETEIVNDVVEQIEDEVVVVEEEAEQELVEEESPAVLDDEKIGIEEPANTEVVEAEMTLVEAEAFSTTGPQITYQTESIKGKLNDQVTLKVVATGDGLNYQWRYKKPGATSYTVAKSADAKKAEWTFALIASVDGREYQCVVTDGNGNRVESEPIPVTIVSGPEITSQTESIEGKLNDQVTLKVVATGDELSYQWRYKKPGATSYTDAKSADAKKAEWTFALTASMDGREYQCVVTDKNGNSVESKPIPVTIIKDIVIDGVTYKPLTETTCAAVAYDNDPSRTSLNIPKIVDNKYTVTEIGEANNSKGVFEGCTALTSIDLPNDITVIHARAFKDCTNLSTMTTH